MIDDLSALAIKKSIEGNWEEAAQINLQIVEIESENVQALCRLAKAQTELGNLKDAQQTYQKVLKLDQFNVIAKKNIERLKTLKPGKAKSNHAGNGIHPAMSFLEEPGKTKTVTLVKLGSSEILTQLDPGDLAFLTPRQHSISLTTSDGSTIGRLSDDISARLFPLIKGGNEYSAIIRSVSPTSVRVLLREEKRGKKFKNTPSFPSSDHSQYVAFIPPELIHEDETETAATDDDSGEEKDE
jgi:hypothetical protein